MRLALAFLWLAFYRKRFVGPPQGKLSQQQTEAIHAAEVAVHEIESPGITGHE